MAALQKMMFIKARVRRDGQLVELDAAELVPGRRRRDRGRRHRPRRRAAARGGDARGRRVGPDRREPAGLEVGRHDREPGHAARRPHRHGLHEHERDPRNGAVRRHGDGYGHRGRSHLEHAPAPGRDGHAADPPAAEADDADPSSSRRRPPRSRSHQLLPRHFEPSDVLFTTAIAFADRGHPDEPSRRPSDHTSRYGRPTLAKANAIVKRLRSTRRSDRTSAINSDKTGTLTLNPMTAVELAIAGRRCTVPGTGYSTTGRSPRRRHTTSRSTPSSTR